MDSEAMLWGLYREIGTRIKTERQTLGFNQIDLASEVGLTRTSIANIESGRQRLPLHTLYAIADAMGISVHCLLPKMPVGSEVNQ